jgi:hypothetical protein
LLGLFFGLEVEGEMFLRNVGCLPTNYTALYARTKTSVLIPKLSNVNIGQYADTRVKWENECDTNLMVGN